VKTFFVSKDLTQGHPISFTHHPMTGERGKRQHWAYSVTFAGGAVEEFMLPCPSVPVSMDKAELLDGLENLNRQAIY
jgi:hypothetical protein